MQEKLRAGLTYCRATGQRGFPHKGLVPLQKKFSKPASSLLADKDGLTVHCKVMETSVSMAKHLKEVVNCQVAADVLSLNSLHSVSLSPISSDTLLSN